jgi:Ca2+-dependent lipid-binding protein
VILEGKEEHKTATMHNNMNPVWNSACSPIAITDALRQHLNIEVKCYSIGRMSESFGAVRILCADNHHSATPPLSDYHTL